MRVNHKQQQLIDELFNKVKEQYPEIVFKDLQVSPDDHEHIWINVIADMDEDRQIEMTHLASDIATDILMDYGYMISIMPENPNIVFAWLPVKNNMHLANEDFIEGAANSLGAYAAGKTNAVKAFVKKLIVKM